jgi:hypothetical protein
MIRIPIIVASFRKSHVMIVEPGVNAIKLGSFGDFHVCCDSCTSLLVSVVRTPFLRVQPVAFMAR